jgi:hypothetical protein
LIKQKDVQIAALTKSLAESNGEYLKARKELENNFSQIKVLEGKLISSDEQFQKIKQELA